MPPTGTRRVLVVDDHPVVAEGVRMLLARTGWLEMTASATTDREAERLVREQRPDLVLLDPQLSGASPPELVVTLRRARPGLRIVLFTATTDAPAVTATLAAGVDGCLLKDIGPAELVPGLESVLRGVRLVDPRIGRRPEIDLRSRLRRAGLTRREYDVVRLVSTGQTNLETAARLQLAPNTVKSYLQAAMGKLGARNRVEVVGRAREAGLI